MSFKDLIFNKSTILVGPATTLKDRACGKWIDSFETIIRTNGAIDLLDKESYCRDYGMKCDILYVNQQFAREMSPFPFEEWKQAGLKFIVYKSVKWIKENDSIPTRSIIPESQELNNTVKGLLYGPMILRDLLEFKPKELWITGFDFYQTKSKVFTPGDYQEYAEDYLPDKIKEQADVYNLTHKDVHNQKSNTLYIKSLYDKNKINMDNITREAMFLALQDK